MRKVLAICAVAGVSLAALAAAGPAEAAFHVIRWQDTGFCQIWDESIPTVPFPSNYTAVSLSLPTFYDALLFKDDLLRSGGCSF